MLHTQLATNLVSTEQEDKFITAFFGESEIQTFRHTADIDSWSVTDMNAYYEYRPTNEEIFKIHLERRKLIIKHHLFTPFDEYQLLRDKDQTDLINQRDNYGNMINTFSNNINFSERCADEYFLNFLIKLLNLLRIKLISYDKQIKEEEKKASEEETKEEEKDKKRETPPEILRAINQIDAICENLAISFLRLIDLNEIDNNSVLLKTVLKKLNAIDEEIFPWLGLYFKEYLLNSSEDQDKLIDEYLKILTLRHEKSIHELLGNITGLSVKTILVNTLKEVKNTWHSIRDQTLENKLKLIDSYQLLPKPSDWLAMNICMDLFKESKVHGNDANFVIVAFKFFERVKADRFLLAKSYDYLNVLKIDLRNNSETMEEYKKQCPALYISLQANNLIEMQRLATEMRYLPPSTELFYNIFQKEFHNDAGLEDSLPISQYQMINKQKFFTEIFSDRNITLQEKFLISRTSSELGLNYKKFPLLALRLHYSGKMMSDNVLSLWEAVFDDDKLLKSDFFAHEDNLSLFDNLKTFQYDLANANKIKKYPARYKNLVLALSTYRSIAATCIDPEDYGHLGSFISPSITFSEDTKWSEKLYSNILKEIAYPNNSNLMDFKNIVNFIDLEVDAPKELPKEDELISQAIQQGVSDFYFKNPMIKPDYVRQLLYGFMRIYTSKKPKFEEWQIQHLIAFPLNQMPTVSLAWLDTFSQRTCVLLPDCFSDFRKYQFLKIINTEMQRHLMNNVFGNMLDSLNGFVNDSEGNHSFNNIFGSATNRRNEALNGINFMMQLYHAYSQVKLSTCLRNNTDITFYNNFMLFHETPKSIIQKFHALFTDMQKCLNESKKNQTAVTIEKNHLSDLQKKIHNSYSKLGEKTLLDILNHELKTTISSKTFNKSWFTTNPYHTFLINVQRVIQELQDWQKMSYSIENNNFSVKNVLHRLDIDVASVREVVEVKSDSSVSNTIQPINRMPNINHMPNINEVVIDVQDETENEQRLRL